MGYDGHRQATDYSRDCAAAGRSWADGTRENEPAVGTATRRYCLPGEEYDVLFSAGDLNRAERGAFHPVVCGGTVEAVGVISVLDATLA